jgi:hypothetical protein
MDKELQGPFLAMAVLCEKVLREADGVISVIRVVDRVNVELRGPGAPDEMPPIPISLNAVLSFKSGFAKGKYKVKLITRSPSGVESAAQNMPPIFLEGDERGANLIVSLQLSVTEEGLYWIDVLLEERVLTRIPLRVLYQSVKTG